MSSMIDNNTVLQILEGDILFLVGTSEKLVEYKNNLEKMLGASLVRVEDAEDLLPTLFEWITAKVDGFDGYSVLGYESDAVDLFSLLSEWVTKYDKSAESMQNNLCYIRNEYGLHFKFLNKADSDVDWYDKTAPNCCDE